MSETTARRKYPAHPPPVRLDNRPVILFVTVCLLQRRDLLANVDVHSALRTAWAKTTFWVVGFYLIMPDHIHFFCAPGDHTFPPVKRWVKYWKRLVGEECPRLRGKWLKDCWDTQMRTAEHYERKLEYTAQNPVRAGLVERPEDWAFCGRMSSLRW